MYRCPIPTPHQRTTRLVSAYNQPVYGKEEVMDAVGIDDAIPTPAPVDPTAPSTMDEPVYEIAFDPETYEEKVVIKSASKATKTEETLSTPSTTAFKVDLIKKENNR